MKVKQNICYNNYENLFISPSKKINKSPKRGANSDKNTGYLYKYFCFYDIIFFLIFNGG